MSVVEPCRIIRHLRRAALRQAGAGPDDAQLMERFLADRDESAFEALVRRHGSMVFGVCRRVLGRRHDAEDAFHATFLVLACKAAGVRNRAALASWLYGVAYRTAGKARAQAARRRIKERKAAVVEAREDNHERHDLARLLDYEVKRLSDKYRTAVILCDLEGVSRKEAARRLGLPEGTVSSRLAAAREMLAKRLTIRGVALATGGVAAVLAHNAASACVPAQLIGFTVQAAAKVAAGHAVSAAASAPVAALAKGVMKTMLISKFKVALGLVVAFGLMTVGWGAYQSTRAAEDSPPPKEVVKAPAPETPDDAKDDDVDLPTGPALTQVRVRIDKEGRLVVKTASRGLQGANYGSGTGSSGQPADVTTIQIHRYDLADVKVVDAKGKKVEEADLARLLKKETIGMATFYGQPVDPLHLRVLKEGTLVFALPAAKPAGNAGPNHLPGPQTAPLIPADGGLPAQTVPANKQPPRFGPGFPGQPPLNNIPENAPPKGH